VRGALIFHIFDVCITYVLLLAESILGTGSAIAECDTEKKRIESKVQYYPQVIRMRGWLISTVEILVADIPKVRMKLMSL
jgi:hypothetical protein